MRMRMQRWGLRADVGSHPDEVQELWDNRRLRLENRRLRKEVEMLRGASIYLLGGEKRDR